MTPSPKARDGRIQAKQAPTKPERTAPSSQRREESLSRERILEAAIELLDASGEAGLTFRALAERLSTGAGAIYWHIANKSDLLTGACDSVVERTLAACGNEGSPKAKIRALALGLFDAIDKHPWVGSALTLAPAELPTVRLLERLGQQLRALGVPEREQWATVSTLLNYIFGVGGQNAANAQVAQARGLERESVLDAVAKAWSELDAAEYPFTRDVAKTLRTHDDRADFLAGINLLLKGIDTLRR